VDGKRGPRVYKETGTTQTTLKQNKREYTILKLKKIDLERVFIFAPQHASR
jgi:hypothetical protein